MLEDQETMEGQFTYLREDPASDLFLSFPLPLADPPNQEADLGVKQFRTILTQAHTFFHQPIRRLPLGLLALVNRAIILGIYTRHRLSLQAHIRPHNAHLTLEVHIPYILHLRMPFLRAIMLRLLRHHCMMILLLPGTNRI